MTAIELTGTISATALAAYTLFITCCWLLWPKVASLQPPVPLRPVMTVTVVVVARDEEEFVGMLLKNLAEQAYPRHLIDIVLVDDQSQDETITLAASAASELGMNLKIISLDMPASWTGSRKKPGIQQAAAVAGGEILLLTDADCQPGPDWVGAHVAMYQHDPATQLAFGAFTFRQSGWLAGLLNLEAINLTAVSAVTSHLRMPTMCSGANLSYRKNLLADLNPFQSNLDVASGDDDFMLQAVHRRYPNGIRYVSSAASMVQTRAPASLTQLYYQRRRWSGKWKEHRSVWPRLLAVFIFFGNLAYLICAGLFIACPAVPLAVVLAGKWLAEYLLSARVAGHFMNKGILAAFLPMEIIYPFYAVFFGIASNFGNYHWKGREYP